MRGTVGIGSVHDAVSKDHPSRIGGFGVMGLHPGTGIEKTFDNRNGRTLSHVVRLGLEGKAPDPDRLSAQILTQMPECLLQHNLLLTLIYLLHGLENIEGEPQVLRGSDQRLDVFGKAGTAVARTGVKEGPADPLVGADSQTDVVDVRAHQLAEQRYLVHE